MAWALVLVAVIAVGLPGAAWWLSRNLKPLALPLGRPTPRSDPIDRWLFDHYQLGTVARGQVKTAVVLEGQVPGEPCTRPRSGWQPRLPLGISEIPGPTGGSRGR